MQRQSAGVRPWLDPLVYRSSFEFSPASLTVTVCLSKCFDCVINAPAHFDLSVYVLQSVCLNTGFIFLGRWYYIVVVPVSPSTRRWKNPDEMDLDEVSASRWLIGLCARSGVTDSISHSNWVGSRWLWLIISPLLGTERGGWQGREILNNDSLGQVGNVLIGRQVCRQYPSAEFNSLKAQRIILYYY